MNDRVIQPARVERPTSGSYPTPEPLTIAEVVEQIAAEIAWRCDDHPIGVGAMGR